ncbi:hypothetical protein HD554DRAFT_2204000 [Boletus coccyginus]|nr:hypothetical protein HD554DRAFT_2204000 [Boletus coccyginus]
MLSTSDNTSASDASVGQKHTASSALQLEPRKKLFIAPEYLVFCKLPWMVPSLLEQVQKGVNGTRANDTKGMKSAAFKHIFTLPSLVKQQSKAMQSGNAHIHGISIQVFSQTDLTTDSEHFYNSILKLLDDPDEKDEIDQLMVW